MRHAFLIAPADVTAGFLSALCSSQIHASERTQTMPLPIRLGFASGARALHPGTPPLSTFSFHLSTPRPTQGRGRSVPELTSTTLSGLILQS
jgi:hypothetical protein